MPFRLVPRRDRKLHRILGDGEALDLCRGETLYRCGDRGSRLWLVRGGHVRLRLPADDGVEGRTVAVVGPYELFGEEALATGNRRPYRAVAGEPCSLSGADGARVLRGLRGTRHTLSGLFESAAVDLARTRWAPPGTGGPRTAERLADILLELAVRFGEPREGGGIRIPLRLTHSVLADLAGAHRSTVTTLLNEWLYEGILEEDTGIPAIAVLERLESRSSGRERWVERPKTRSVRR